MHAGSLLSQLTMGNLEIDKAIGNAMTKAFSKTLTRKLTQQHEYKPTLYTAKQQKNYSFSEQKRKTHKNNIGTNINGPKNYKHFSNSNAYNYNNSATQKHTNYPKLSTSQKSKQHLKQKLNNQTNATQKRSKMASSNKQLKIKMSQQKLSLR
jgi:hypothetical protein